MKTPKISVWAFNHFVKFDAFIATLGCAPKESSCDFARINTVKMVNTVNDFKMELSDFLTALEAQLTEAEIKTVREDLFKKNGELRSLAGKTVKFNTNGFFVNFDF